ncbi:MAG: DUF1501 domain-containing protein [Planctomycetota bacterium]|nr:DUF1501 domain-containing protein [Planctomycetota bacterium]
MHPYDEHALDLTRRRFFGVGARSISAGLGMLGLGAALGRERALALGLPIPEAAPGLHHPAQAKRVVYLHMEGAPSQLDLYDYKPGLLERFDQDIPDSIRGGQRLTGMTSGQARFPCAPSAFRFDRAENSQDGVWLSELLPRTAGVARDLCFVHSMHTEAINHEPAITFFQTGNQQPGRPSFGAWASYGLGSENQDLPAFVVLITQGFGNMQALSARFWGAGFLSSEHQGCRLRSNGDPVLYLADPPGVSRADRRKLLDLQSAWNVREAERALDPEVRARIAQAELAYRMQTSVPGLLDLSGEPASTFELYGEEARKPGTFAANCLLARRLLERGVRFVQLYLRGWDQHSNLPAELRLQCQAADRAQAALVTDLKQRGLLDDTIVLCAGEFGRTVYSQGELSHTNYGRDHHPRCFTVWLAGGGFAPGITYGKTDDWGYNIVENPIDVHDLHATMLRQLGIDHERLTYRHQGRDFRLTDVFGKVVPGLLSKPA